jgi:DNA-binding beta-propeller fold protein YncE
VLPVNRRDFVVGAAALVLAPEAIARRLGGTPTALVTADLEAHIVAIELLTGRRLREIPTKAGPRSIEQVGNLALVAHTEHGALSVIDGTTLRVRHVIDGFREPRYAAAAHDGRHAFVTDSGDGTVAVVDVAAGTVRRRIALGGPARHVSYDAARRLLWVALGTKAERVAAVDVSRPGRPRLLRHFAPPFLAHDVGLAPGGSWVTSGAVRELVVYRRGRALRLRAGSPPQHVTFLDGRAFVSSGDDGTLRVHDAAGRLLRTSRIPTGSYNVQHAFGGLILMPSLSRGTLCIADATGRVVRTVHVARSSHDACFVMTR